LKYRKSGGGWSAIGRENYFLSADGLLMPVRTSRGEIGAPEHGRENKRNDLPHDPLHYADYGNQRPTYASRR
jgi:hypothetical protein